MKIKIMNRTRMHEVSQKWDTIQRINISGASLWTGCRKPGSHNGWFSVEEPGRDVGQDFNQLREMLKLKKIKSYWRILMPNQREVVVHERWQKNRGVTDVI
jgi:hypothetical protein